jgi:hypothetical protein
MQADRQLAGGRPPAGIVRELSKHPRAKSSAVLSEKLGDLWRIQNRAAEAVEAYAHALGTTDSKPQRIRLLLAQADLQAALGADAGELETRRRLLKESPSHANRLEFQQRLLTLAMKNGDVELTKSCQEVLRQLTTNPAPAVSP